MDDREVQERVARVGTLLEELESLPDSRARTAATETVRALLDLYGEGLARVTEQVARLSGEDGLRALAADELVAHLLLLHGLHPVPLEERVAGALEEVRPYLRSHGGNVELLGITESTARLRLQGSCNGCPSSAMTLKLAIEEAITRAAPDLDGIETEGVAAPHPGAAPVTFVPRSAHAPQQDAPNTPAAPAWTVAGVLPQLAGGGPLVREVAGEAVLFLRLDQQDYAYQPRCPGCAASLGDGTLRGAELTCRGCGHTFDMQRAGRCLDAPRLHLEPIPLLISDAGLVKIALHSKVG